MKFVLKRVVIIGCLVCAGLSSSVSRSQDWPTFAHDAHRSAATTARLDLPLHPEWVHHADQAPAPAWPPPAKHDYWHRKHDLHPRVTFDHACQVVIQGNRAYYGSSTDDSIVCLDLQSGGRLWTFYTEGPVRLAPTLAKDQLLVGSDDGHVYCLQPDTGQLVWKQQIGPSPSRCIGNGRMISRWPVRSGLLVRGGLVYGAAGLFPTTEGVFLFGLDLATGTPVLQRKIDQSVQGYLAVTSEQIILPSGRAAPWTYRRGDGEPIGEISSEGGTYTVVSEDLMVSGRGDGEGRLALASADSQEHLLSLRGLHLIAHGNNLYVQSRDELAALDRQKFLPLAHRHAQLSRQYEEATKRKDASSRDEASRLKQELATVNEGMEACWIWKQPCDNIESLILAGDILLAGGDRSVVAFDAGTGHKSWDCEVDGRACGLAATPHRLLVSTDRGTIYCFHSQTDDGAPAKTAQTPATDSPRTSSPQETSSQLARTICDSLPADQGFCLIVGDRGGSLAAEIARRTRLRIILVQRDSGRIDATRTMLRKARLLGTRVVVHQATGRTLSYPPFFANLIVLSGNGVEQEVQRLLRPDGGVAWIHPGQQGAAANPEAFPETSFSVDPHRGPQKRWTCVRRLRLPDTGQWTHGLADPGNTACSQDELVAGPVRIQWFGRPGPRVMADRHHRNVAPLYKSGRLFVPGENLVIAVDAYNGTELWKHEIPNSLRLGAFLDCSNMVVDDRSLFVVAEDACHQLDVATGKEQQALSMPQPVAELPHHWGYVARAGQLLLGSGRKPGASYFRQSRQADSALWYDNMSLVTSDYFFALPRRGGNAVWTYQSGVIINSTITIGGDHVYFLESHAPEALHNKAGRMPMSVFLNGDCYLIALDLQTGELAWKKPFDLSNCQHIVYLNYARGKLVVSGNRYVNRKLWYFFEGLDAATGDRLWQASANSGYDRGGDHGEQNRHPTIVGNTVYTYPHAYDLRTGQQLPEWQFDRMGHGCGNISASAGSIFWRGDNPWRRDLVTGREPQRINSVNRPGCYINIIPAGGMLLIPEASSGCTCGFPLQTSLAYIPESLVTGVAAE